MATQIQALSVFFPAYNEEANIKTTVLEAKKVLEKVAEKWEIIIVDDGSKDKTGEIADSLCKQLESLIKVVHHSPNRGYGGALKSGFEAAKYEWVAFADSDGQFDFSEIKKLLVHINSADLILGFRLKRADPPIRVISAFFWRMIPRILWGLNVRDYSCGFKLIKKKVFDEIQPLVGEEKVTQIEMLVKAKKKGFKFAEVGVHHFSRKFGKQTGADIKVVFRSFIDLFRLWEKMK